MTDNNELPPHRIVKNNLVIDGTLDAAFNAVLREREPDALRCILVDLAHKSVDAALAQRQGEPVAMIWKDWNGLHFSASGKATDKEFDLVDKVCVAIGMPAGYFDALVGVWRGNDKNCHAVPLLRAVVTAYCMGAQSAPATAEQPAEPLFIFERDDGRYAVGPEGAAFTVGEPAWHRLGVVSLLVAAPVAEGLIDALARIKHCTQHVGDDLARTIRGIGFIADAAIASTKKDEQA